MESQKMQITTGFTSIIAFWVEEGGCFFQPNLKVVLDIIYNIIALLGPEVFVCGV